MEGYRGPTDSPESASSVALRPRAHAREPQVPKPAGLGTAPRTLARRGERNTETPGRAAAARPNGRPQRRARRAC